VACDRVDQDHRRQLAAGQDVIADRDLPVHAVLNEPLVHAFVAAGDEDQPWVLRELTDEPVVQQLALR
jgi:hypothetical protein